MRDLPIAGTSLVVSAICLGGVALSTPDDLENCFALLDRYLDAGGNMVDTANIYGKWFPGGRSLSELNIGAWLSSRGIRNQMLVTTKGGHPDLTAMDKPRLARRDLARDLENSLRNLQVETIDLYWLHRDDPGRPAGEILEDLNGFIREGKIRHIGCSNWQPARIASAQDYAATHKIQGFCANQLMWSMALPNQDSLDGLAAMDDAASELHRERQLPAFAFMSLANGFFSKLAVGPIDSIDGRLRRLYENKTNLRRFEQARQLSAELGLSVTALAVAYLTSQTAFPVIPVVGCRTVGQLDDVLTAADLIMDAKTIEKLA